METFLARITKLTASMPDTALPVPVETPRSITPNQSSTTENFALSAGSALAGWAMAGLKSKVLGTDVNGEPRTDPATSTQSRSTKSGNTSELRGSGIRSDVDAWKDDGLDDDPWTKPKSPQKNTPAAYTSSSGMTLPVKNKKKVVEQVVEEEQRKSVDDDVNAGAWPVLDGWGDDDVKDDGWGFDDD
jgi:hypothetical protein